ncbi:hypothetical protein KEJ45_03650 [Candidatus Bathyarchaeota archaeon]|nr:hypothetical protein [Candidatus Bathyarchaeota archaeon]
MAKSENVKKEEQATVAESNEDKPEKQEIEKLKFNVEKLSEELNTAVAELKRSIIDIRSAVSEIENPFNLLRVISSEKDLKKLNGERLPPGVKSLVLGKPEEKTEERTETLPKPTAPLMPAPVFAPDKEKEAFEAKETAAATTEEEKQRPKSELPPSGTVYLDWVWSLLDLGFSPDDIKQLSESYERLGFLPEGSNEQVYSLAIAAEKAKSKGLTRSKLLLNMYKASAISGMCIGLEDVKRLISIAEGRVREAKNAKRVA